MHWSEIWHNSYVTFKTNDMKHTTIDYLSRTSVSSANRFLFNVWEINRCRKCNLLYFK